MSADLATSLLLTEDHPLHRVQRDRHRRRRARRSLVCALGGFVDPDAVPALLPRRLPLLARPRARLARAADDPARHRRRVGRRDPAPARVGDAHAAADGAAVPADRARPAAALRVGAARARRARPAPAAQGALPERARSSSAARRFYFVVWTLVARSLSRWSLRAGRRASIPQPRDAPRAPVARRARAARRSP